MILEKYLVNPIIRFLTGAVCKIDASQLSVVPDQGPLITVTNHINFLEAPILYTRLQPRPVTGFAKIESWDSWWMGMLFNLWGIIPLKRSSVDTQAIRRGLEALDENSLLAVAPEGTRSGDGVMQKGHPGVVLMALRSGAPILPIGIHGSEDFWSNLKKFRRTDFHIEVGRPFVLRTNGDKPDRHTRSHMLDEIMYSIAALVPDRYRGHYSDLSLATSHYLEYLP